uniref:Uncharacterized protein n=2 Tax=Physcomitrium patens TaxID=3218 RepID=A0A7I4A212_PHYPA
MLTTTMRKLKRTLSRRDINPLHPAVGFALLCFSCVYLYTKYLGPHW